MNILLLEDETDIAEPLVLALKREYQVCWAKTKNEAWDGVIEHHPELCVLDIMLPEGENAGFEFAQELRQGGYGGYILFLTARDALDDRVQGLDIGADDYLVKPFHLREFLARVRALSRRDSEKKAQVLEIGSLKIDTLQRQVWVSEQAVFLQTKEYALLEIFASAPSRVFSTSELADRLFAESVSPDQTLRVYINHLRKKLGAERILTVPMGYTLNHEL